MATPTHRGSALELSISTPSRAYRYEQRIESTGLVRLVVDTVGVLAIERCRKAPTLADCELQQSIRQRQRRRQPSSTDLRDGSCRCHATDPRLPANGKCVGPQARRPDPKCCECAERTSALHVRIRRHCSCLPT